jgi:hypothetical protein
MLYIVIITYNENEADIQYKQTYGRQTDEELKARVVFM